MINLQTTEKQPMTQQGAGFLDLYIFVRADAS